MTLYREGYEFQVSNPVVIYKEIDGVKCEPIERLTVDVPDEYTGTVMDGVINRKGEMTNMAPTAQGYTRLEFLIPSRGLIGYRSELLTATKGTGIINSILEKYEPYKGDFNGRTRGTLMSLEQCLDFIADDELLEVTPNHLRMRKKILSTSLRAKAGNKKK